MTFKEAVKRANNTYGVSGWSWNIYPAFRDDNNTVKDCNWISVEVAIKEIIPDSGESPRWNDFGRRTGIFGVTFNNVMTASEEAIVYLLETYWDDDENNG